MTDPRRHQREGDESGPASRQAMAGAGMAVGIGSGMAIGGGLGAALGNIALGVGIGLALGSGLGIALALAYSRAGHGKDGNR